jgi:predicted nucleotide-binding protein
LVAEALGLTPTSRQFRGLAGAAQAYGLTDGGYNASVIELTELGRRIVAPTAEGMTDSAVREALLRPRVLREFLTVYNNSKLPAERIARNVLETMGVGADATGRVYAIILESAREVGVLRDIKGSLYVDLEGPHAQVGMHDDSEATEGDAQTAPLTQTSPKLGFASQATSDAPTTVRRVFVTHGKNLEVLRQLKELLTYGGFEPIVSIDRETVAKPVPDKVLDDMRSCGAAIIHVGGEQALLDREGNQITVLNPNVMIEIGAAMALYGRRFILLVESGVTLPSNLQGLYEVRYQGDKLDYEATMRLLKALTDFKTITIE